MGVSAWKRGVDESLTGYECFLLYLSLGPRRSLFGLKRRLGYGGVPGKSLRGQVSSLAAAGDWGVRAGLCDAALVSGELGLYPLPRAGWLSCLCGVEYLGSSVGSVGSVGSVVEVVGNVGVAKDDVTAWRGRLKVASISWNSICESNIRRLQNRIAEFTDADYAALGPKEVVAMVGVLQKLQKEALDVEAAAIGAGDILDQLSSGEFVVESDDVESSSSGQ